MRRLSISLYLLIALAELIHWAIVPLIPEFAERFSLSDVEAGALVASTGLATLVISVPAGLLADRLGARRLTLLAGSMMAAATFGQALAPSYAVLLAARLLFGLGFGIVWTAGLAWMSTATATDRPPPALGATVTSAGLGIVIAPGFAGLAADQLGLAAPFVIAAVAATAVTLVLATAGPGRDTPAAQERLSTAAIRAAAGEPGILAALLAILLGGLVGSTISLLAPLELHAAGLSKASIGLVFSAAALIFILASAVTVKLGERVIHVPAVLAGALAFALTLTPATLSGAAPAIVAVMCLGAPLRALLFTVSYPLGAARGSGVGAAMGMLNGAWAITSVVGPLGGGALAEAVGARGAYGSLQALSLVAIGALWLHLRRATVSCVPGRVGA